jgi:type I restriction enzyme, R subunit
MSNVGQKEHITQNKVVQFFELGLKYDYLGDWKEREDNSNIEPQYLIPFLKKQGYSKTLIAKAIDKLTKDTSDLGKSLYDANKDTYSLLRYGVKVRPDVGENKETVWLIDWQNPSNNHFAIAEEVTVSGNHTKRPDIVIYVNGIALGVIELKRSTVGVTEGIRQNLLNQEKDIIGSFFSTMQLVMAGNETEGLRYGAIETSEKYYLQWKENSDENNKLLKQISQLCNKERFLEIIHDFIVFDKGVKKLCRHNQYFGVKAAQERIQKREGGIIWHTQGSGKSLTMVWLTKWLRENVDDARVLLITDREELDEQIEKVFKGVQEDIYRTKSGRDLVNTLNQKNEWLICTLVHKFGRKDEADYDAFADELINSLPKDFKAKGNLFVFVDECHRTQSGSLNKAMRQILPNALFIGFTGTPLLKKDKQKSIEIFGSYIHTYKFDEAVNDKVVLDLRYEARNVDQNITSQSKIDQWFDAKTKGLTDIAKRKLKQRWGTMQKVLSSQDRLNRIVDDILMDFEIKDRLQNRTGNAMLVSGSIYQACRYYDIFQRKGFKRCAIVTSYNPTLQSIKDENTGEEGYTEKLMQYETYNKMLKSYGYKNTEDFEKEAKKKFIDEPAQMKLLIVVDKLLTGFDAPSATYLYIDKQMRDHGLFQAICRVNRLDGESKEYGYIIDYKDLFKSLENSINDYTKEAFGEFDKDDVQGLLDNRLEKAKERLENARETIKALCEPVFPQNTINFQRFFCGISENKDDLKNTEPLRVHLYKYTVALIRSYANIANEMDDAGYSATEIEIIKQEVRFYTNLRDEIEKASGDYIDLKRFEPAMRHLIDSYIRADESEKVSEFDDLSLIQLIVEREEGAILSLPENIQKDKEAVAETIENNLRKVIIEEAPTNPLYFEKMSVILDELILERKREAFDYKKYLQKIIELTKKVTRPSKTAEYPNVLDTNAKRALYDNLGKDEALAVLMDETVKYNKQADFRGNKLKEKKIKIAIKHIIPDGYNVEEIFEIIKNQNEY